MAKCRRCGAELPAKKDDWPVRCPKCRDPLFERPGGPQLVSETRDARRGTCAVHATNVAVGNCPECGQRCCSVCRTRWHDQVRCLNCVEKKLEDDDPGALTERRQRWQGYLGLGLGGLAWLLLLFALLNLPRDPASSTAESQLVVAGLLFLLGSLPACAGLGQALAALIGNVHKKLVPLFGLLLNSLFLGLFLGTLVLRIGRY